MAANLSQDHTLEEEKIKGLFLNQIIQRAAPTYRPTGVEKITTIRHERGVLADLPRYPCLDCGDIFLIKRSIDAHRDRRSVLITLICTECHDPMQGVAGQRHTFFNRCSLLGHL